MARRTCSAVLLLLSLSAIHAQRSVFSSVVSSLGSYQTLDGGFRTSTRPSDEPSLEATSHALFLSSLYGLRNQINIQEAQRYIEERENSDGGYGKLRGHASDMESLRHALLSFQHLGVTDPSPTQAASFVASLFDEETHLFRTRVDDQPNLKSTAIAFDCLARLGEHQRWEEDQGEALRTYLKARVSKKGKSAYFSFPEEPELSQAAANHYAILLGTHINFDFGDLNAWATFIVDQQAKDGGFYESDDRKRVSLDATSLATSALGLLQGVQESATNLMDRLDTPALIAYLRAAPRDLTAAGLAHLAVASTSSFTDNFKTSLSYERRDDSAPVGEDIVQGAEITPILTVTTFNNVAHAGLDVEVEVTFPDGERIVSKMLWDDERECYMADQYVDTAAVLGPIKFEYTLRCYVATLGGFISFEVSDAKSIGYGIRVESSASFSGNAIADGEPVSVNTDFEFKVALWSDNNPELLRGDFTVSLVVLDASGVELSEDTIDGKRNKDPLFFQYTLKDTNLPAGDIVFAVQVANAAGTHTRRTVSYPLSLHMVAVDVKIQQPSYQVGATVRVSMLPASKQLRTVSPFPAGPNKSLATKRVFYMDVSSVGGVLLQTVRGKPLDSNGNSKYAFELQLAPSLQSLGTNMVTFRYAPVSGRPVHLRNYDRSAQEYYEDVANGAFNYTVDAELEMYDVSEQPTTSTLNYGDEVAFDFKLKDKLTSKIVSPGSDKANVVLELAHLEDGVRMVTATSPAEAHDGRMFVRWVIDANAVTGKGHLGLVAQDADGTRLPLSLPSGRPLSLEVEIGGKIEVVRDGVHSSSSPDLSASVFVAEFRLRCLDHLLPNALLRASVGYRSGSSGEFTPLPGLGDIVVPSNSTGSYQVSWTLPHTEAHSGDYQIQLFREIDRRRAHEAKEQLEQRKRKEEAHSRRTGQPAQTPNTPSYTLTPFIELVVSHTGAAASLPIKMDVLALAIFFAASVVVSRHRTQVISLPSKKSR